MIIREATREDFVSVLGKPPDRTVRALAMVENDKPVALAGYFLTDGGAMAFSDVKEGVPKRALVKGARAVMKMLKKLRMDIYASPDHHGETVLKHFGFEPDGELWRLRHG